MSQSYIKWHKCYKFNCLRLGSRGSSKCSNALSGSINAGEIFDQPSICLHAKTNPSPWSFFLWHITEETVYAILILNFVNVMKLSLDTFLEVS